MNLQSVLDQWIDDDICEELNVYSLNSIAPSQLQYLREEYYRALFSLIKERKDEI